MYRSVSTNRVADDGYYSIYNQSPTSKGVAPVLRALSLEVNEFSENEPSMLLETPSKKEKVRAKFSEKAVHIIPFVLLFCALFLWMFSNPDIEMPIKSDLETSHVKGITLEGDGDTHDATTHVANSQRANLVDMGLHRHDSPKLTSTVRNFQL